MMVSRYTLRGVLCPLLLALGLVLSVPLAAHGANEAAQARAAERKAKAEERKAKADYRKAQRQRKQAIKKVTERADEFLLAMRWRDFQEASRFYEDSHDQVVFLQRMTDPVAVHVPVDQATVDFVLVDEANQKAEVRVTFHEVDPRTQNLGTRSDTLLWYFSDVSIPKDWYLVPVVALSPDGR